MCWTLISMLWFVLCNHFISKAELPKLISKGENKEEIEHIEAEIKFLQEEMVHGNTSYPNNVTITNFLDYLLVPSLVYWMEYPRTDK